MTLDFLAIGDITIDAFIRLKDAHVNCGINKEECEICMKFASKIPYDFMEEVSAVGNSANAAVCASRLGLSSFLLSNVGSDKNGHKCLQALELERVGSEYIEIHPGEKTNYHFVLWYEAERTILVKHQNYKYRFPYINHHPRYVYLSSLGDIPIEYYDELSKFLEKEPYSSLIFQPGTFQLKLGVKKLEKIYKRAKLFFCNFEEARELLAIRETKKDRKIVASAMLKGIHDLGPKMVVITDGPSGAYGFDGKHAYFMPPYPDPKPPYERTGAGDAFAATFSSALALGKSFTEALAWAPINSMSVVQYVGAQKGLLGKESLLKYLESAPKDYLPQKI